jgi:hypothetical protein
MFGCENFVIVVLINNNIAVCGDQFARAAIALYSF